MPESTDQDLEKQLKEARDQISADRKLIRRAADALAEIDRGPTGLIDEHAEVLVALRIRLEGKKRASLDELLTAAGDIKGKKELGDVLADTGEKKSEWPELKETKKEWPGL